VHGWRLHHALPAGRHELRRRLVRMQRGVPALAD
jgi:hypothetical protein